MSIVVIVVVVFGLAMTFGFYFLKAMNAGNESVNQNSCRANLRTLQMAMFQYADIQGRLPGYVDVLRKDQAVVLDPKTQQPLAVSWVVHLMPHLEHASTFERWQQGNVEEPFIPVLVCPSDSKRSGPALSYVGNSGMPDVPGAAPVPGGPARGQTGTIGIPRDWQANGVFFNTYSDDPAVSTDKSKRIPRIIMRSSDIRDPKDRTIVFTENVDTSTYTLPQADARSIGSGAGPMPEVRFGCVWGSESIQDGQPPVMTPPQGVWRPQQGIVGKSASYARPYSKHQGGFNAAFAAGNVLFLSDKLSYFVYAKLMASDDVGAKQAGTNTLVDPLFRSYQIIDAEIHP